MVRGPDWAVVGGLEGPELLEVLVDLVKTTGPLTEQIGLSDPVLVFFSVRDLRFLD